MGYYCDTVADKAVQLFGHAETTSLSVLCALENIDCSKGVGVAGYSQGAAIGSRAAMNDDRVTAFLGVGLNTIFLYTDDGAAEATCFRDATLPPSARRYLNGGDDVNWAAGNIAQFPAVIGGPFGMEPQENLDVGKYSLMPCRATTAAISSTACNPTAPATSSCRAHLTKPFT